MRPGNAGLLGTPDLSESEIVGYVVKDCLRLSLVEWTAREEGRSRQIRRESRMTEESSDGRASERKSSKRIDTVVLVGGGKSEMTRRDSNSRDSPSSSSFFLSDEKNSSWVCPPVPRVPGMLHATPPCRHPPPPHPARSLARTGEYLSLAGQAGH